MDPREELQALRRLAELEAKASGGAPLSSMERITTGMVDPIQGGAQLLTRALPESVVSAGNRFNNWLADTTGLVGRLPAGGVDQQTREREAAYKARRNTDDTDWLRLLGNVVSPVSVGLGAPSVALKGALPRAMAGAATGGAAGALAPVTGDDFQAEKTKQLLVGAAAGGLTPLAVSGVSRLVSPKASTNPQVQGLLKEGVRPTIGQTLGGWAGRLEEKATSLPVVGDSIINARTRATEDLNRAVAARALKPIGADAPKEMLGRDLVEHVGSKLSDAYDALLPKLTTQADGQFNQAVSNVRSMVRNGSIDPNVGKAFDRIVQNDMLGKFKGQNAITGRTLKQIESDLGQKAAQFGASTDADQRLIADALRQVQSELRSLVQRTNPKYAKELRNINEGYANFLRMERASTMLGAEDGVFTAAQLQNAVKTMDRSKGKRAFGKGNAMLQDLSDPAKTVMGPKVPDSGTAGRILNLPNLMAAGTAVLEPTTMAAIPLGAAAYTPAGQSLLRWMATSRYPAAQPIAGILNQSAPMLAPAGGLLAIDQMK